MTRRLSIIAWSLACAACVTIPTPQPQPPTPPNPPAVVLTDPTFPQKCADLWPQELDRAIEPSALQECRNQFASGRRSEQIRAVVHDTPEGVARRKYLADAAAAAAVAGEDAKTVNGGERGRIHVANRAFVREDGSTYPWLGASDFLLFDHFRRGLDIVPDIASRIQGKNGEPLANLLRVFTSLDWRNQSGPQFIGGVGPLIAPDATYYADLKRFVDLVWSQGVRLELSGGDLVKVLPNPQDRIAHIKNMGEALRNHPGIFVEIANEPGHGDQISVEESQRLGKILQGYGILCTNGFYDIPNLATTSPRLDYTVIHPERKAEWPRNARWNEQLRDGFSWDDPAGTRFDGMQQPVVDDEATGAAEVQDGDKRSANCDDFAYDAGAVMLFSAGGTYHSNNGIYSNPWEPVQYSCALQYFAAARFIPPAAQFGLYQRGGAGGGAGVNNMPVVHFDLEEAGHEPRYLRTFCKAVDRYEYCVGIRPTQPHFVPRDGWVIDLEPRPGLVRLIRHEPVRFSFTPSAAALRFTFSLAQR